MEIDERRDRMLGEMPLSSKVRDLGCMLASSRQANSGVYPDQKTKKVFSAMSDISLVQKEVHEMASMILRSPSFIDLKSAKGVWDFAEINS
ncbi:hypothetical protein ACIQ6V_33540, partial [Streptomyces sp. NPDC096198]|uniref:hypothetical protein n=1 Tax=Streptomyces sp. NPDC096198 TaxID=3366080 RepID=UPI00381FDE1B